MKTAQVAKDPSQTSASRSDNRVPFFLPFIQPKLTVNASGDEYEQEADAVADKVMRMKDASPQTDTFFKPAISSLQRKCHQCEEEDKEKMMQRKSDITLIQRDPDEEQPAETPPAATPDVPAPVLPNVPNFQLPPLEPVDYLGINRSFLNRGLSPYGYGDAAKQEWSRQYQLYSTLGAGNVLDKTFIGGTLRFFGVTPPGGDWNAWLSNQTTPKAIDSALQRDYPNLNEQEERRGGLPSPTLFNLPSVNFKKEDGSVHPNQIKAEAQADAVANAVTGDNGKAAASFIQAKCTHCEAEEKLQHKENGESAIASSTENYINTLSGGKPLGKDEKGFFEDRIGYDFSDVRIHNDSTAQASAKSVNALAYTHGNNIVFGAGQYQPDTDNGKKLMAHELTHVVQQNQLPASSHAPFTVQPKTSDVTAAMASQSSPLTIQRQVPPATAAVTRSNLSGLRTIAQGYIGDYFSAASSGLSNFERDVQSSFDWGAFWLNVAGNVVWATASFATGGTAFIISLAGIGVSTYAGATAAVTSAPDFHREATNGINGIVTRLNNEVDRVTRDVDAAANVNNWDDNRTRLELLRRLLDPNRPEFVLIANGGLPNLNQPAVAGSVEEQLLLRASQMHGTSGITHTPYGPAHFEEEWRVEAFDYYEEPLSGYTYPSLRDPSNWFYNMQSARIVNAPPTISNINDAITNIYQTYNRPIGPAALPMQKQLTLMGDLPFSINTYYFDQNNNLLRIYSSNFEGWLNGHGYNGARYLTALLQLIQTHAHAPIPTARRLS